jgi:hypothetical protein
MSGCLEEEGRAPLEGFYMSSSSLCWDQALRPGHPDTQTCGHTPITGHIRVQMNWECPARFKTFKDHSRTIRDNSNFQNLLLRARINAEP